jgi:hypothetical protein
MRGLAAAAILIGLVACSKSDELRDSVTAQKPASAGGSASPSVSALPSEVPNSASPDDVQVGGGIKH